MKILKILKIFAATDSEAESEDLLGELDKDKSKKSRKNPSKQKIKVEKPESDDDDDDDDFQGRNSIKKDIKTEPLDVKPGKGNSKLKQKNSTTSNISEPQPSTSKQPVSQNLSKQVDFKFSLLILHFSPFFVRFVHLCLCYLQGTMKEPPAIQRANESPRKIEKVNKMQVIVPRLVPSPPNGSSRAIIKDDDGGPKSPNSSAITWISDEVMSNTKILETSNELVEAAGQDGDTVRFFCAQRNFSFFLKSSRNFHIRERMTSIMNDL